MDAIRVTGIRFHGHHGVREDERTFGQRFEVDVELGLDLTEAARGDDLGATVDYAEVVKRVREAGRSTRYRLLEGFAGYVAEDLLRTFPVDRVRVLVRKVTPPIEGFWGQVEVEISREREG
ncbi:MAG: dihydroneopterin aldolase [Candidatus Methylomirabilales bacterium]